MKWDFAIGNPPYMETTNSDSTRMPPVYDRFMDAAFIIADKVELITPARFLFDAGFTPHSWNLKMLSDEHYKVLHYESDCTKIFPNTDIKGGVAISYRDSVKTFGKIGIFTKYKELNSILQSVSQFGELTMDTIIYPPLNYKLSDVMLEQNTNTIGRLRTNAFETLRDFFYDNKPQNGLNYSLFWGMENNKRTSKYIRTDYLKDSNGLLNKYNLILAVVNGNGQFGEELSASFIAEPNVAYSQTFIAIGKFNAFEEAYNADKYTKSKFCRTMLGIMKITPQCSAAVWGNVPLQDFTANSDINWSVSIANIDKQLYKKYGLSQEEIDFIETHVKEME